MLCMMILIIIYMDYYIATKETQAEHFTDLFFQLSWIEYEAGQYNTIQYKNLIEQYNLVIVQQLCTVYKLSITNYK